MAKGIANPAQSAAAQTATAGMTDVRTGNVGRENRFALTRPLTRFERQSLRAPVEKIFVYNISPIFKWQKDFPGLGPMTLNPRGEDEVVSKALVIEERAIRAYDKGDKIRGQMVEEPLDIVQDFLSCSPDYPGRPENNLTTYGAFYLMETPLDELPADERQAILDEAELKHRNRCHEKVGEAEALQNTQFRVCITEVHKKCALYLHKVGDIQELPDWVQRRAKLNTTDECKFCGFENRRGVVKCRNCHEVLDQEAYDKLKGQTKKKPS